MSSTLSDVLLGGDVEAGGGVAAVGGAGGWTLQLALAAGLGSLSAGLFGYRRRRLSRTSPCPTAAWRGAASWRASR